MAGHPPRDRHHHDSKHGEEQDLRLPGEHRHGHDDSGDQGRETEVGGQPGQGGTRHVVAADQAVDDAPDRSPSFPIPEPRSGGA